MTHPPISLLADILIIFALSIGVIFLCHRLRMHMVIGLLITGVLAGPHGLHLITNHGEVEVLAELGVILLLFTIGIEFSLKHLLRIARAVFLGGGLQVGLTVGVGALCLAIAPGMRWNEALFCGLLLCLSSTAIVLKLLQERAEMATAHGQVCLAILIFQDMAVVPMMLLVPILAGTSQGPLWQSLALLALKGVAVVALTIVAARYVVPRLLFGVARMRSREIFLIAVLGLCVGITLLTSWVGLSLALGAFLAGLIISESEYSHQALGNIQPFKDVFTSFFFVSIGMLLDLNVLIQNLPLVLALTIGAMLMKLAAVSLVSMLLALPLRIGLMVGFAVCQIGEFSFILARVGADAHLISENFYQLFLAVTVMSMSATPFIVSRAPALARLCLRLPLPERLKYGAGAELSRLDNPPDAEEQRDHLVIVGFGITGKHLASAIATGGIPYVVVETNPETVAAEKALGEPIFFGDASEEAVLRHARVSQALVLAITVPDPIATRQIVATARHLNPDLHIVARTRYVREVDALQALGANDVLAEEFETSLQLFARVLEKYLLPRDLVEQFTLQLRAAGPHPGATPAPNVPPVTARMPDITLGTFRVAEGAKAAGAAIGDLPLDRYQAVAVARVREGNTATPPDPADVLRPGDQLLLAGRPDDLAVCEVLFHSPRQGAPPG